MTRLPKYLEDSPRRPPWQWALAAAVVHAVLWLGLLVLLGWPGGRQMAGPVSLATLVVGVAAWLAARRLDRAWSDDASLRARLFEVIDCLPDPVSVRDLKGRYVLWNRAAEEWYGLKREHVLGRTPTELYPPDVLEHTMRLERLVRAERRAVDERVPVPPMYGHGRKIVTLRVAPVQDADDPTKLRGIVSTMHDLTRAEEAAEAAQRNDSLLRQALGAAGAGMWSWNLATDVAAYSESFCRLLRYTGKDFRRDFLFRDRLHPQDREATLAAVQRSVREKMPFDQSYRLLCFDGVYRRFRGSGECGIDPWGAPYFAGLLVPLEPRDAHFQAPQATRPDGQTVSRY